MNDTYHLMMHDAQQRIRAQRPDPRPGRRPRGRPRLLERLGLARRAMPVDGTGAVAPTVSLPDVDIAVGVGSGPDAGPAHGRAALDARQPPGVLESAVSRS